MCQKALPTLHFGFIEGRVFSLSLFKKKKIYSTGSFLMISADHLCPSLSKGNKAKRWRNHGLCIFAGTHISIQKEVRELLPTFLREWRKKLEWLDLGGGQTPAETLWFVDTNSMQTQGSESQEPKAIITLSEPVWSYELKGNILAGFSAIPIYAFAFRC